MAELHWLADYPDRRTRGAEGSRTDGRGTALLWRRFDRAGLPGIVQLINGTDPFNLTGRRISDPDVLAVMAAPDSVGLQLRLLDRLGDTGLIGVVVGRLLGTALVIDTWVMRCRGLGRGVEPAILALLAAEARRLGARRLIGEYVPTAGNALVRDHYARLGFTVTSTDAAGASRAMLALAGYVPASTPVAVKEG